MSEKDIRAIAIHLPQFHPIPENDKWWGKGFTEWTKVTSARPLFKGHYQPHLPTDLGYYDLRLEESRIAQAELAKSYGIYGFCYYHYWFNGKRMLNRPLDDMISTKTPDFPFMLCWANENWTRRWDGDDKEILMKQEYNQQDDIEHIRFLCKQFFSDSRYIRVNNKPFFVIYRPSLFPDIKETIDTWRREALKAGFELYIGFMQGFSYHENYLDEGFDCLVEFHPRHALMPPPEPAPLSDKLLHHLNLKTSVYYSGRVASYEKYAENMIRTQEIKEGVYPGITPMWDNTARNTTNATLFHDSTPALYKKWLTSILKKYQAFQSDNSKYVFINAWNEWAEGNHLEPCLKWGNQYLEVTKHAFDSL